jgi:aldehyde dehydrogenase (NAD+)
MLAEAPTLPITELLAQQRAFFATGASQSLAFRKQQLRSLLSALERFDSPLQEALWQDLHKPEFEAYGSELGFVKGEIKLLLKQLDRWAKPEKFAIAPVQFPGQAYRVPEPLGVVLIISPWNYPVQLLLAPLVGAIAAGNCAILKPSELTPQVSAVLAQLISATFAPDYVALVEGGVETSQALLAEPFDHLFFTGGTAIGKIVMAAAARHLTPVTLELGGKSPCIVEPDADLAVAARRIAWGKCINAGQTCIAPDYLLVHETIRQPLLELIRQEILNFYGEDPQQSPDYCRIVSPSHWDRLQGLIDPAKVFFGGQGDRADRYLAPTILTDVTWDDAVMADEIFGPILPVLTYGELGEAIAAINARPKPLALYLFGGDRQTQQQVQQQTSSGGLCFNDVILQISTPNMPFGGIGPSGLGAYHGKASFERFSHYKSILKRPFWLDLNFRYPPYPRPLGWLKSLMG